MTKMQHQNLHTFHNTRPKSKIKVIEIYMYVDMYVSDKWKVGGDSLQFPTRIARCNLERDRPSKWTSCCPNKFRVT